MPNRHRILIVDDDPGLRDGLTEQLSLYEEFEAVAVENGIKGVQAAKADHIDLVIMDVGLPDIDGREVVGARESKELFEGVLKEMALSQEKVEIGRVECRQPLLGLNWRRV
jgi:DNA-binding response OmpR family regulator